MKKSIIKNYRIIALMLIAVMAIGVSKSNFTVAMNNGNAGDKIPGQYIVVFKDSVVDANVETSNLVARHGLGHLHTYNSALKGFAATIPASALENIKKDPRVRFVSEDRTVSVLGKPGSGRVTQPPQSMPTGINRIGAANLANKGAGINVAVIDTGIDASHPDLAGQVIAGVNCSTGKPGNYKDGNGHGTHVAGTIAALNNDIGAVGVAPEAKLLAVRVLDNAGNGTWSSVICGVDWVTSNAVQYNIKVANMSLGGNGASDNNCGNTNNDALHKAICKSRDAGVAYVVAAGNESDDVANHVPSSYNDAVITVSALVDTDGAAFGAGSSSSYGADDTFASFSNYGSAVDIAAPGVNILSTWKGGGYNTISGTSMAAPHVAGAAALYLAAYPGSAWTAVRDGLITLGENSGSGHTGSATHSEPVVKADSL